MRGGGGRGGVVVVLAVVNVGGRGGVVVGGVVRWWWLVMVGGGDDGWFGSRPVHMGGVYVTPLGCPLLRDWSPFGYASVSFIHCDQFKAASRMLPCGRNSNSNKEKKTNRLVGAAITVREHQP